MSFPSTNTNQSLASVQKSMRQQLLQQKLKFYKMYGQVYRQGEHSDQSSSINPSFEQSIDRFKSSKEQISGVSLFNDLPLNLLEKPKFNQMYQEQTMVQMLFGDDNFNIFDSIVSEADAFDQEIVQTRRYKQLIKDIQELQELKTRQKNKLIQLQGKNIAYVQANNNLEKISQQVRQNAVKQEKINKSKEIQFARSLRQGLERKKWFQKPEEFDQQRQNALGLTENYLQKQIVSIKAQIQTLKKKKQQGQQRKNKIKKQILQTQQRTVNRRFQRKKLLMDEYIRKQETQLARLKASIAKMEKKLSQSK